MPVSDADKNHKIQAASGILPVGFLLALCAIRNPTYSNEAFRNRWDNLSHPDVIVTRNQAYYLLYSYATSVPYWEYPTRNRIRDCGTI
jgi:hypothetical protein